MSHQALSDDQLRGLDVPTEITAGLRDGRAGTVAVAAALAAERLSTHPRSLTFLAEIVRRGGIGYAATLPEPLPTPEQAALAAGWLTAADRVEAAHRGPGYDERVARWLENVALVLATRRQAGAPHPGTG